MSAAIQARAAAVHFEAKKTGFGQAQDGWSITLRVQHNDLPAHIKDARKGTRYMVALVEIGDDEQPINRKEPANSCATEPNRQESSASAGADKPPKSPAQIAGYLCTLGSFQTFLRERFTDQWVPNAVAGRSREDVAKETLYDICAVTSRTQLSKDNTEWHALQLAFKLWEAEAAVVPA